MENCTIEFWLWKNNKQDKLLQALTPHWLQQDPSGQGLPAPQISV
jgi:hypothetical protein